MKWLSQKQETDLKILLQAFKVLTVILWASLSGAQTCEIEVLKASQKSSSAPKEFAHRPPSQTAWEALSGGRMPLIFNQGFYNAFQRFLSLQKAHVKDFSRRVEQMTREQRQQLASELWAEILVEFKAHPEALTEKESQIVERAAQRMEVTTDELNAYRHTLQAQTSAQDLNLTVVEFKSHQQVLRQINSQPDQKQAVIDFLTALLPSYARHARYDQVFREHVSKGWIEFFKDHTRQLNPDNFIFYIFGGFLTAYWTVRPTVKWLGNTSAGLRQFSKNTWNKLAQVWTKRLVQRQIKSYRRHMDKTSKDIRRDLQAKEDALEQIWSVEDIQNIETSFDLHNPASIQTLGQELMSLLTTAMYRLPLLVAQSKVIDQTGPLHNMRQSFRSQRRGEAAKPIEEAVLPFLTWLQSQQSQLVSVRHQMGEMHAGLQVMASKAQEMIEALQTAETSAVGPVAELISRQIADLQHLKRDVAETLAVTEGHQENFNVYAQSLQSILQQLRDYQRLRLQGEATLSPEVEAQVETLAENFVEL